MRRLIAVTAAVLAAASLTVAPAWVRAAPAGTSACAGYAYGGYASRGGVHGIAATVTAVTNPVVASGHAAAWVGVGDKRRWLQVGVAAFPRVGLRLYLESRTPGRARSFVDLGPAASGSRYRIAVRETAPDVWAATIEGRAAGREVSLPAPHGAWRGIATAETWSSGDASCSSYGYRFDGVAVLGSSGWIPLTSAERVGHAVRGTSPAFVAAA